MQELQGKVQVAEEIQEFIRQRESQLKEQLSQYGLGKQLLGINETCYYYQQQINDYKELLRNQEKLEEKIIATIRELHAFKDFWQKN